MTDMTLSVPYGKIMTLNISEFCASTDEVGSYIPRLFGNKIILTSADQQWFWSEEWQAGERKVDEHIQRGEFETFDTMEDFLDSLGD